MVAECNTQLKNAASFDSTNNQSLWSWQSPTQVDEVLDTSVSVSRSDYPNTRGRNTFTWAVTFLTSSLSQAFPRLQVSTHVICHLRGAIPLGGWRMVGH